MTIFTFEEKLQLTKWYFNGMCAKAMGKLYFSKYGKVRGVQPSPAGITYPCEKFEKTGCIQGFCPKCNSRPSRKGRVCKRPMSDERELNEIMVCGAAELELRIRDIAIELEIPQKTVTNILRRNGYSIMSLIDESTEIIEANAAELEKVSSEKRQVVKWYCQGKTLSDIIELYDENFKQIDEIKEEILKTILQFEKCGCLFDCEMCTQKTDERRQSLTMNDVEGLIIKQVKELEVNNIKKKDLSPQEPANEKIKLECYVERTVLSSQDDSVVYVNILCNHF